MEVLIIFSPSEVESPVPHSGDHWLRPVGARAIRTLVKLWHTQAAARRSRTPWQCSNSAHSSLMQRFPFLGTSQLSLSFQQFKR